MCLAIPSKIIDIHSPMATVEVYGARKSVSLMLMPEEVVEGDYVLVHAGFAIQKVSKDIADEAYRTIREMARKIEEAEERGEEIF